ncbi:fanconi-associated nuclease, partial [Haematococcus lacustris]
RRIVRLGRPPRRWKKPSWAAAVMADPPEVVIQARPLAIVVGVKSRFYSAAERGGQ